MPYVTETYIPKPNKLWARMPEAMTLKGLALAQVLKDSSAVNHPLPDLQETQVCLHLESNFIPELFRDLIQLAYTFLLKPQSLLNVLYGFPRHFYESYVDLLGLYEGTECCKPSDSTLWMFGNIPDICLDTGGCKKLVNLLRTMDMAKLKTLRLWAKEGAIFSSRLPRIFPKAVNLTRLTLRGDADDHILRIIGANCDSLEHLDVSRSTRITNYGLFNLVLKKRVGGRKRKDPRPTVDEIRNAELRPIANSLDSLILTKSQLGVNNLCLMGHLLRSYVYFRLPEANYSRVDTTSKSAWKGVAYDLDWAPTPVQREALRIKLAPWISADLWTQLQPVLATTLTPTQDECQLDIYRNKSDQGSVEIYAHQKDEWLLHVIYRVSESRGLTQLTINWDKFNWDITEMIQLTEIAGWAPNLERLQGRLSGSWQGGRTIFESLTDIHCWILEDSTIISLLRSCPNLKTIDIKNVRAVGDDWVGPVLNHQVLLDLMKENPGLWTSVQLFLIRPTNLTKASVLTLTEKCPRLTQIGDLECWDVNEEEIKELNTALYNSKSRCSLVVLSFPPRPKF